MIYIVICIVGHSNLAFLFHLLASHSSISVCVLQTLKAKSCHDAIFVVTDGIGGCLYDNLQCHQWRQSRHYDNSWFSVKANIYVTWMTVTRWISSFIDVLLKKHELQHVLDINCLAWAFNLLLLLIALTHWGWDKRAAIFQTTFSNAFSFMKIYELCLTFCWSLILRFELAIFQHWFR